MKIDETSYREVAEYWNEMDGMEKEIYSLIHRERPGLTEDLSDISERYRRRARNTLTFDEVNILHRRIQSYRADAEDEYKEGFVYLFLRSMAQKRRITARNAILCEYMMRYMQFQRKIYQKYYVVIKRAVAKSDPDGRNIADKQEYRGNVNPLYGVSIDEAMDTNAAYYMRRLRDRVLSAEDVPKKELDQTIKLACNDMLGRSERTKNFFGFLDRAWLYELGQRRVEELRRKNVQKVWFVAVLDDATTDQCRELNGNVFRVSDLEVGRNAPPIYPPPHPCRSRLVPVVN